MKEQTLFDPRTVEQPRCTYCDTTRKNLCRIDADVAKGLRDERASRPSTCLNSAQNRDGVPYG